MVSLFFLSLFLFVCFVYCFIWILWSMKSNLNCYFFLLFLFSERKYFIKFRYRETKQFNSCYNWKNFLCVSFHLFIIYLFISILTINLDLKLKHFMMHSLKFLKHHIIHQQYQNMLKSLSQQLKINLINLDHYIIIMMLNQQSILISFQQLDGDGYG